MAESEAVVIHTRQVAIKLAKNLEPFNADLGQEFDAVYIETLTEDIKQLAREIKKLATVIAVYQQNVQNPDKWPDDKRPLVVIVDGEEERVTKLMRRYSTRMQKMADLLYEVAYIDFEEYEQENFKQIMAVDEEDNDDEDA
jgi:hypothetical protein